MARTLLESTLKTIFDDRNVSYRDGDDLPALYRAVSAELALAPGAYSEESFKQILGGCNSVVVGLGSLRNKASDAHGSGRTVPAEGPQTLYAVERLQGSLHPLIETRAETSGGGFPCQLTSRVTSRVVPFFVTRRLSRRRDTLTYAPIAPKRTVVAPVGMDTMRSVVAPISPAAGAGDWTSISTPLGRSSARLLASPCAGWPVTSLNGDGAGCLRRPAGR